MWNSSAFITDKGQPRLPNTNYSASITRAGEAGAAGAIAPAASFLSGHAQKPATAVYELAPPAVEPTPLRHGIHNRAVVTRRRRGRRIVMRAVMRRRSIMRSMRRRGRRRRRMRTGLGIIVRWRRRRVRAGLGTIVRFRLGTGMRSGMILPMMRTGRRRRSRESAARAQAQRSGERRAEGETIRLFHGQHLAFIGIDPAESSIPNRRLHISIYIKNIFCQTSFSVCFFLKTLRNTRRRRSRR